MDKSTLSIIKQYTFVISQMSATEHKHNLTETNLGRIWSVLNPLMFMIVLSFYYQNIITHDDVENFPVFVFSGFVIFSFYSSATKRAMKSLVSNQNLLLNTKMPTEFFIYQSVYAAFREMMFSCIALIFIMFFYKIKLTMRFIEIVPIIAITIIVIIGMGKILSVIYVYFADIDYLYSVFMTLMMFVSGVFIPLSRLPEKAQYILKLNPIFLSIYLSRNAVFYNLSSHWTAWLKLILWAIFLDGFGTYILKKNKNDLIGKI